MLDGPSVIYGDTWKIFEICIRLYKYNHMSALIYVQWTKTFQLRHSNVEFLTITIIKVLATLIARTSVSKLKASLKLEQTIKLASIN